MMATLTEGQPMSSHDDKSTMQPRPPAPADDERTVLIVPGDADATRIIMPPPAAERESATQPTLLMSRPPGAGHDSTLPPPAAPVAATLPGGKPGDEQQGRQVGRYRIHERIGRGGMATVYRATDPSIGRELAIKFLHATLCEDEECRSRFLREARAAGGLSHPNIVIVHDVGEIEGRPYMAMELLRGVSLAAELQGGAVMPVRDVVIAGIQLARALDYAHGKGIVHRDIKPGNIMRLTDGQTIKVTDFGIAHMDEGGDATGAGEQHTRLGDVLGTPEYMSPEQTRGEKLDGRSDLFSTGIVLYQMLTGVRPFKGDTPYAVATKVEREEPTPVDRLRPDVPGALRRVVARCMAKQPEQRFQSGRELADALVKVLAEIDEAAQAKARPRIVPLRVKWAATMALIVVVVMGATAAVITQRQYAAMMGQVSDYGASLARFIAKQNATAVLAEDWVTVEVAVQEIMKTRNFERVTVVDLGGVVRASSVPALVGQPYRPPAGESLGTLEGGIVGSRYDAGGQPVLGFEGPVTFQDKTVGRVALGIPEKPLSQVARLSITLMAVLVLVTVLAVAIAMYFVADWFAKPIKLLRESMAEIARGRFDHRIREQRNDEFGQLYAGFDAMAQALQERAAALAPPTPSTPSRRAGPATTATGVGAAPGR
jgi:eukaryotic-like serine/threonine-protein kinase